MIQDIVTVMWKEYRELRQLLTGTRSQWISLLIFLGIFGVMMPLQMGKMFVQAPMMIFIFSFMPLFIVIQIVPDSFAGERERHTLETLLATRLSDRGILLGKLLTIVFYGWGMALGMELIMLLSVNLIHYQDALILPPGTILIATLFSGFLVSMLGACLGVCFSLKAQTVKQAQQTLALIVMALWFLPFMLIPVIMQSLPKIQQYLPKEKLQPYIDLLRQIKFEEFHLILLVFGVIFIMLMIDLTFLLIIMKRFKRSRLILN